MWRACTTTSGGWAGSRRRSRTRRSTSRSSTTWPCASSGTERPMCATSRRTRSRRTAFAPLPGRRCAARWRKGKPAQRSWRRCPVRAARIATAPWRRASSSSRTCVAACSTSPRPCSACGWTGTATTPTCGTRWPTASASRRTRTRETSGASTPPTTTRTASSTRSSTSTTVSARWSLRTAESPTTGCSGRSISSDPTSTK
mmetsp:Transcript_7445/g.28209  ORF Transcript_7445/g.28209 Transcript_7445/m.28209 type:complete len:201 (-) Transcript_7445:69-671(-)